MTIKVVALLIALVSLNLPAGDLSSLAKAPFSTNERGRTFEGSLSFEPESLSWHYGSKQVIFQENGTFRILSDGRQLGNFYVFIATPFQYWQTNDGAKKLTGEYEGKSVAIREVAMTGDTLCIEGLVPWQKPGEKVLAGTWKMEVKQEGRNRLAVLASFTPPPDMKAQDHGMFLNLKNIQMVDAGPAGKWAPQQKGLRAFTASVLKLVGMNPADSIQIETDNWTTQGDSLRIGFKPGREQRFVIDLGESFELGSTTPPGGVDLLKTDALRIPVRGRNLFPNPYFADKHRFSAPHFYRELPEVFTEEALFGRYAIGFKGWHRFATVPADPGRYTFSFYAKGKGWINYVIRSAGARFEKNINCQVNSPEQWKRYALPFDFPLANAIVSELRLPDGILIDGIQLEKGGMATEFEAPYVECCSIHDDFFGSGTPIRLEYELSTLEAQVSGKGTATIRNFFSEEVFHGDFSFSFVAGQYPRIAFEPGVLPDGLYIVQLDFNKAAPEQFFRFAVMPFLENRHKTARVFALSYEGGWWTAKNVSERYLARLQAIGIGINGHSFQMAPEVLAKYEQYGVIPFDLGFASRTRSESMAQRFPELKDIPPGRTWFFVYNSEVPSWYDNNAILPDYRLVGGWNEEYRRKFMEENIKQIKKFPQRFAYRFASEWPSEIKDDPHYPELYAAFREAVHSVYPDALVYEAGDCNMDVQGGVAAYDKFLRRIRGLTSTDFVSAHTYTKDIRQLYTNFRAFVEMTKKHPGYENCRMAFPEGMHFYPYSVPAWGTEFVCWMGEGWRGTTLSYDLGWLEKLSAAYYARSWLIYLTEFERVWCVTPSAGNTGNFAMDSRLTPRAFQKIPNTLGVLLGNPKRFLGDITFAPDSKCFVWEDEEGRPLAAVWNEDTAVDAGIKDAPLASMKYVGAEYIDLMGNQRQPAVDGEFPVSAFPLFIRGRAGDEKAFVAALSAAILNDDGKLPCRVSFELAGPDAINLVFVNPLARELAGSITIAGQNYTLAIPKLGEQTIRVKLAGSIVDGQLAKLDFPYECSIDGRIVTSGFSFTGFSVKKFSGDWNGIPVIKLSNKVGKESAFTEADFSASYQLAWDEHKLYLRVSVTDDVFAPGELPGYRWNYDVLQVYFDTRCSAMMTGKRSYDEDDYDYGFMPTADGKTCEVWRQLSPDIQLTLGIAAPENQKIAKEIPAKFTRTETGYVYEAEFPADYLLPMKLVSGYNFAFGLYVADKDHGNGVEKGLSIATEAGSGCHNKPHLWPIAILLE